MGSSGKFLLEHVIECKSTLSELFQGECGLDVFHGGLLERLGVVRHDVALKGVDKVAHDVDEDPVVEPNPMNLPS